MILLRVLLIFVLLLGCRDVFAVFLNRMRLNSKNAALDIIEKNGQVVLNSTKKDGSQVQLEFHEQDPSSAREKPVTLTECAAKFSVCVKRGNTTYMSIHANPNEERITISHFLPTSSGRLVDCVSLRDDTQWVGGPQLRYQRWPIQHMYYEEEPYVPTHPVNMAVTERYWLSSRGFSLYVYNWVPLFLDQNNYKDKYLCLIAQNKAPYSSNNSSLAMTYEIAWHNDSRLSHTALTTRAFAKPSGHPDARMIQQPIWSTWARYKMDVNEKVVDNFASEILAHKFNNSQLEIDDNWETCYGSAVFDPVKFPNVSRLTARLRSQGFRTTLWIHPFINEGCEPAYSTALKNGYFVKTKNGVVHTTQVKRELERLILRIRRR